MQSKKISENEVNKANVGKYLTDMKELPPTQTEDMEKPASAEKPQEKAAPKAPVSVVQKPSQLKKELPPADDKTKAKEPNTDVEKLSLESSVDEESNSKIFTFKDIILGVINLASIIFLIILLIKLPKMGLDLKNEKIQEIQNSENPTASYGSIDDDKTKADKLASLFLDEQGIVNFVNEVEKLKTENSAIKKITFPSQKAVKDKIGLYGIPVIIELRGNWTSIGTDLEKIQVLPFLFRPVSIDAGPAKDDPDVIVFHYGGFLYVSDKLIQK